MKKLQLKNFRPFKDERVFDFKDQVTVIAGVNGHGKTAILDSLSILLSRLLPQISRAVGGYKPLSPGDHHHGTNTMLMSISANCAGYPVTLSLSRDMNDRRTRASGLPRALKNTIRAAYGSDPTREGDAAPIAVYYTTDRAGYKLPNKMPKVVPRGQSAAYYGALWDRRMDYRDLMARLAVSVQLDPARQGENPNFIGRQTVETMNRVLAVFLEGFNGLRVDDSRFRLVVDKNGVPLDIPHLSDGERSFLAIVTDLCRRLTLANPGLNNPLDGQGVALIDELELHLHPTWQRDVIEK
ncbi:MAG TPA: AAA family ATPase, partial [Verrucomicrobia bacterium]|nr:AAA family ATPase [Verrucomicrobiota bacterium]